MTVSQEQVYQLLKKVKDPEVPVLDVVELGVVRSVSLEEDEINIEITPTYSGCPAMKVIETEIISVLNANGLKNIVIKTILTPAWTTDWMNEEAKQKLKNYGIAPPEKVTAADLNPLSWQVKNVDCPFCNSEDTELTSQFGSTACKALYFCNNCRQPFEHFKCI